MRSIGRRGDLRNYGDRRANALRRLAKTVVCGMLSSFDASLG